MQTRQATLTLEELIETMGNAFKETYSPRVPAELTYIVVIGDCSELEVKTSDESGLEVRVAYTWLSCRTTFEQRIVASMD